MIVGRLDLPRDLAGSPQWSAKGKSARSSNAHRYESCQVAYREGRYKLYTLKQERQKLEHNLGRGVGHIDIVPIERSIHTMGLLLDGHWEFLEWFDIESALPNDPSEFSSQTPLVVLTSKERD